MACYSHPPLFDTLLGGVRYYFLTKLAKQKGWSYRIAKIARSYNFNRFWLRRRDGQTDGRTGDSVQRAMLIAVARCNKKA